MKITSLDRVLPTPTDLDKNLRILMLADDEHPANVVRDHIREIVAASQNSVQIINPVRSRQGYLISAKHFDAILIHYSIAVFSLHLFPDAIAKQVAKFRGPKIQIVQDEYRKIDQVMQMMCRLGVTSVFSSLSADNIKRVYGRGNLENATFYSCLPGYVSRKLLQLERPTVADRPYHLVYRGRTLPVWLGQFGREKVDIAVQAKRMAEHHSLSIDVSCDEADRIYGDHWWDFLQSGKAALALEGGSSVFDFDGSIQQACEQFSKREPDAEFDDIWHRLVKEHDGNIVHKTITPRVLEAIIAGTPLVMYPGAYRGVLEPWTHYIPLEPDGSNEERVSQLLKDANYLQELADRAYAHVCADKTLHFAHYVKVIHAAIAADAQAKDRVSTASAESRAVSSTKLNWIDLCDRAVSAASPRYVLMRLVHLVARSPLNRTGKPKKNTTGQ
jgi:hypothetical protein